jgi:collagenase-like PrtC family protease
MTKFSVTIPSKNFLIGLDRKQFDIFYLGNPFCALIPGNLLTDRAGLRSCIKLLQQEKKSVSISTPSVMLDVPATRRLIELARETSAGVEVADLGALKLALEEGIPDIALSPLANIRSRHAAKLMKKLGVHRIHPDCELGLAGISKAFKSVGVEVETTVHGRICLGLAGRCYFKGDLRGLSKCPGPCQRERLLAWEGEPVKGGFSAMLAGTAMVSDRIFCAIEHLDAVLGAGVSVLRFEGLYDEPGALSFAAEEYRAALMRPDPARISKALGRFRKSADISNGFLFSRTGREYFGRNRA